ncbi:hypothetical protein SAMN05421779_105312 [Insolitispirillum peregrinum]|uniref:Uncharacterized protein n=1 Tax=Insolitispirillum peregrinum TaxID=80876 RepID=A0A1N7NR60_9PROT|nr:hypothetical protein SAMN05421779_105312 [Insolitispirillum peregrinum]
MRTHALTLCTLGSFGRFDLLFLPVPAFFSARFITLPRIS